MLKVLIVAESYPFPEHRNGIAKINANLLVENPHFEAEMLCIADTPAATPLRPNIHQIDPLPEPSKLSRTLRYATSCKAMGAVNAARYLRPMADFIVANHERFDIIHISAPYLAGLVDLLPQSIVDKTLLFAIDSMSMFWKRRADTAPSIAKRLLYRHECWRNVLLERSKYPRFPKVVFVSALDATHASAHARSADCTHIPNGVDTEYFTPPDAPDTQFDGCNLVFTGDLSYAPNSDAADFLVNEILPLIPAELKPHLFLVGQRPLPHLLTLKSPNVTVTGLVDDLRPYLKNATLYVSPLRFGSGIKNKILEAMSMGLAVVGTPVSFEGIICFDLHDCIRANPTADEFAADIVTALRDRERLLEIGKKARRLVETRYSWESIRKQYGEIYADCASHR